MSVPDVDAVTDPAHVDKRTTAVRNIVKDIRTEIRRLIA